MDGEDDEFAHGTNGTITANALKTPPHRWIPSYYEFASHKRKAECAMGLVPPERKVTFAVIAMLAHRLWCRARRHGDVARIAGLIRGSPDLFPVTVSPQTWCIIAPAKAPLGRDTAS